ncbi:MAG: pyridoxal phosphate-dependent aminotransferase [Planctomycetes bacterium]|nr:pyridoxal phosphate-dependent aminotransferase [Planctomycetota bacterium]
MAISRRVTEFMQAASWIRRMFEQGNELRRVHGPENVFDFSLGNPDLEPPKAFQEALEAVVHDPTPGLHRYMSNAGFLDARARVAARVADTHGVDPTAEGVVLTVGAAGALNVALKALLDPGSEVIVLAPYFPEYRFYIDNHGGKMVVVPTDARFDLDVDAVAAALTPATRAVIINSPNNPTGRVYAQARLDALGRLLDERAPEATLITDEPYRRVVYDGMDPGSVLRATPRSMVATSFSKDLGLAGERIGYLAAHPDHPQRRELLAAAIFANRTLGFVNAPALMQRVIARMPDVSVDIPTYAARRRLLLDGLRDAGYDCVTPEGAFYLFPRSPLPDDLAFIKAALEERILVVPGAGFGTPGYFRISYAVPTETIVRAIPAFRRARERAIG